MINQRIKFDHHSGPRPRPPHPKIYTNHIWQKLQLLLTFMLGPARLGLIKTKRFSKIMDNSAQFLIFFLCKCPSMHTCTHVVLFRALFFKHIDDEFVSRSLYKRLFLVNFVNLILLHGAVSVINLSAAAKQETDLVRDLVPINKSAFAIPVLYIL